MGHADSERRQQIVVDFGQRKRVLSSLCTTISVPPNQRSFHQLRDNSGTCWVRERRNSACATHRLLQRAELQHGEWGRELLVARNPCCALCLKGDS